MAFLDETGLAEVWSLVKAEDEKRAKVVCGSYTGTGDSSSSSSQNIDVGFRPKAVVVFNVYSMTPRDITQLYSAMAVDGSNYTNALEITDTGFTAKRAYHKTSGSIYFPDLNGSGYTYNYIAIG